jgi:hypothetical protein
MLFFVKWKERSCNVSIRVHDCLMQRPEFLMKYSLLPIAAFSLLALPLQVAAQNIDLSLQSGTAEPDPEPLVIPLDPNLPVSIDPNTGNVTATAEPGFTCSSGCSDVQVSLDPLEGGFFNANGETELQVPEGGAVRFDWRARGAWTCTGAMEDSTGGTVTSTDWDGGGKLPYGPQSVVLSGLTPDVYTASLTCSNGLANLASANPVTIEVLSSGLEIPTRCQGRQPPFPPSSSCLASDPDANCYSYDAVFGFFPGSTDSRSFVQAPSTWVAMEIAAIEPSATQGTWRFEIPQGFIVDGSGPKLMTLSTCPGDFDRSKILNEMGENCYSKVVGTQGALGWQRAGGGAIGACELAAGETYWLNILYTSDPAGTPPQDLTWDCNGSATATCGNLLKPIWQ